MFFILDINTEKIIEKCVEKCVETANYYTTGHSDIKLRVVKVNSKDPNPLLAGARKSTFYIKYLHA